AHGRRRRRAEPARRKSAGNAARHGAHAAPGRGGAPAVHHDARGAGRSPRRRAGAVRTLRLRGRTQGRRHRGRRAGAPAVHHRRGQPGHGRGRHGRRADRCHRRAARAGPGPVRCRTLRRSAARRGRRCRRARWRGARPAALGPVRAPATAGQSMSGTTIEGFLPDAEATDILGRALAATQPAHAVVYLHGDLGAGKSTLARAWLRALGVDGPVRSPTYTLVERYPVPGGEALHLDLYRIGGAGELEFLGLDDAEAVLWLVEWPERGAGGLPPADLRVELAVAGEGRTVRLRAPGAEGAAWLARLANHGDLQGFPESNP